MAVECRPVIEMGADRRDARRRDANMRVMREAGEILRTECDVECRCRCRKEFGVSRLMCGAEYTAI